MFAPRFGRFHQVAWVTNDLDRSVAMFRDVYRIPSFFVHESAFEATVGAETGTMRLRVALANIDGTQLELIEPLGDGISAIYADVLPIDGSYANVFHHFCVKVAGEEQDWDRYMAQLDRGRPVCYSGNAGPGIHFAYTDERLLLGHYVEHLWCGPEMQRWMDEVIPQHCTA